MTYVVRLRPTAQQDLADIEGYFDTEAPHLTDKCLSAIEAVLDRIARHPQVPRVRRYGLRMMSTRPFRYSVWYRLLDEPGFIEVVAVLHHYRKDDALADRVL